MPKVSRDFCSESVSIFGPCAENQDFMHFQTAGNPPSTFICRKTSRAIIRTTIVQMIIHLTGDFFSANGSIEVRNAVAGLFGRCVNEAPSFVVIFTFPLTAQPDASSTGAIFLWRSFNQAKIIDGREIISISPIINRNGNHAGVVEQSLYDVHSVLR